MNADDFSKLATPLAWPVVATVALAVYGKPVLALLTRISETLTFTSLKFKLLGSEVLLTPQRARTTLDELLEDIAESTNELTREEVALFDQVLIADGRLTVAALIPGFKREEESPDLLRLRNLRDQKLIRPIERGRWREEKHPVVTRYGRLVASLRSKTPTNDQTAETPKAAG